MLILFCFFVNNLLIWTCYLKMNFNLLKMHFNMLLCQLKTILATNCFLHHVNTLDKMFKMNLNTNYTVITKTNISIL